MLEISKYFIKLSQIDLKRFEIVLPTFFLLQLRTRNGCKESKRNILEWLDQDRYVRKFCEHTDSFQADCEDVDSIEQPTFL